MTVRQEIHACIDDISESKLIALKPLLFALADDAIVIEHDLTEEEQSLIAVGMAEYEANPSSFVSLKDVD
jgi:hypothetical protein